MNAQNKNDWGEMHNTITLYIAKLRNGVRAVRRPRGTIKNDLDFLSIRVFEMSQELRRARAALLVLSDANTYLKEQVDRFSGATWACEHENSVIIRKRCIFYKFVDDADDADDVDVSPYDEFISVDSEWEIVIYCITSQGSWKEYNWNTKRTLNNFIVQTFGPSAWPPRGYFINKIELRRLGIHKHIAASFDKNDIGKLYFGNYVETMPIYESLGLMSWIKSKIDLEVKVKYDNWHDSDDNSDEVDNSSEIDQFEFW